LEILARKIKSLGQHVTDEDLILIVLQNLPQEYDNTVEILENDLENDNLDLTKVKGKLKKNERG
jgi:gag-polypeptide of LTR copia-type